MAEYHDLVQRLGAKLATDKLEFDEASNYYEAEHRLRAIGISTPPEMRCLTAAIGWPRMYLDAIEERLDVEGFRQANSADAEDQLVEWWQANSLDEESGMGHLEAMIYGRAFVTIAAPGPDDDPDIPLIRVESPLNMYAETDPRTRKVTAAVRIYNPEQFPEDARATLYLQDRTVLLKRDKGQWVPDGAPIVHNLGVVPVVPLVNRERLADRTGKSEITPEIRSFTDAASRAFMNMQAAAELMAVPQRVIFGVEAEEIAPNGTPAEVLDAYMARILTLENEAGKAFQFSAAELRNFTEILNELAKHVASYTGLPPQYLTFSSDNPASAEAIRSSESRLVKKCERKARMFGGSWEQVMRIAKRVMTGEWDTELRRLETVWRDPSTPTFAAKADAVSKLYANGQGVIPRERAWIDLEYTTEEREQMREWVADEAMEALARFASAQDFSGEGEDLNTDALPEEPQAA